MNFKLELLCECGNKENVNILNHEDYGYSVSDSINTSVGFLASLSPDTVYIKCKNCNNVSELGT